jgi:hypothetical protein
LKKFTTLLLFICTSAAVYAQYGSIATDVSLLHNFTQGSKFFAIGQTVQGLYHFDPKTSAYAWICYYTPGRFENNFSAVSKDSAVTPQQLSYSTTSSLRYRQFSVGLRHYFKGSYNSETTWNLYGLAGFGLLMVKAENTYNPPVDTALYIVPQQSIAGTENIVRLTADLGLGMETLLGGGIYLYADARTWIQTTRFVSPYLYAQAVPRVLILSAGVRILFD